jgi:hypothetical protein
MWQKLISPTGTGDTLTVTNLYNASSQTITGTGSSTYLSAGVSTNTDASLLQGQYYYVGATVQIHDASCQYIVARITGSAKGSKEEKILTPIADTDYRISISGQIDSNYGGTVSVSIRAYYADTATQNGKVMDVKSPVAFNLTAALGAGNELRSKDVDFLLTQFPNQYLAGTDDIFTAKGVLAAMNKQIRSHTGAYVKTNEDGYLEGTSVVNPAWSGWSTPQWSFGYDPTKDMIPNTFGGNFLVKDGTLHIYVGKSSRWSDDAYGQPTVGGHALNMWTQDLKWRGNVLVGYNEPGEGILQMYQSPNMAYDGAPAAFGYWRIGSDRLGEGTEMGTDYMKVNGSLTLKPITGSTALNKIPNNSFYLDGGTNTLKWKDNTGTIKTVTMA